MMNLKNYYKILDYHSNFDKTFYYPGEQVNCFISFKINNINIKPENIKIKLQSQIKQKFYKLKNNLDNEKKPNNNYIQLISNDKNLLYKKLKDRQIIIDKLNNIKSFKFNKNFINFTISFLLPKNLNNSFYKEFKNEKNELFNYCLFKTVIEINYLDIINKNIYYNFSEVLIFDYNENKEKIIKNVSNIFNCIFNKNLTYEIYLKKIYHCNNNIEFKFKVINNNEFNLKRIRILFLQEFKFIYKNKILYFENIIIDETDILFQIGNFFKIKFKNKNNNQESSFVNNFISNKYYLKFENYEENLLSCNNINFKISIILKPNLILKKNDLKNIDYKLFNIIDFKS